MISCALNVTRSLVAILGVRTDILQETTVTVE